MTPLPSLSKAAFALLCAVSLSTATFAARPTEIDGKLLQNFKQTFPNATSVKWIELSDKYTVNFMVDSVVTKIDYDKDGNFVSSTRYYTEKNLPVNILCKVEKKYGDMKIFGVTEMTTDSSVEYYIKLEDDKNWITVKSNTDASLQVVEKYKKA